jgi:hypothetical protein
VLAGDVVGWCHFAYAGVSWCGVDVQVGCECFVGWWVLVWLV